MYNVINSGTDPFYNLALEEYIFNQLNTDAMIIWRNAPSIIIGKHQNVYEEINLQFVKEKRLPVIRRLSGGGAVYHDPGNINFTFVSNGRPGKLVDFKKYLNPIYSFLTEQGIDVHISKRNDLFINDSKISGNAEHIFKNRVLHHGTILFNADLKALSRSLKSNYSKYKSHSIKSVRSKVGNITSMYDTNKSSEEFVQQIIASLKKKLGIKRDYILTENDNSRIRELIREKYKNDEWNFDYGPAYSFSHKIEIEQFSFSLQFQVKKGNVSEVEIRDINKESPLFSILPNCLEGNKHRFDPLYRQILKSEIPNFLTEKSLLRLIYHFF